MWILAYNLSLGAATIDISRTPGLKKHLALPTTTLSAVLRRNMESIGSVICQRRALKMNRQKHKFGTFELLNISSSYASIPSCELAVEIPSLFPSSQPIFPD